jgi:hypothetical protein
MQSRLRLAVTDCDAFDDELDASVTVCVADVVALALLLAAEAVAVAVSVALGLAVTVCVALLLALVLTITDAALVDDTLAVTVLSVSTMSTRCLLLWQILCHWHSAWSTPWPWTSCCQTPILSD